ncbi:hypothetical protein C7H19_23040 [Aphanothece hegewaldii CCALA 016]|uniref:DUF2808 domain-containing protein n=1 Tax=Aphanothece hegewaldii CCALA 016 TaxID=2107694 RepID=A0A2T1LRN8_9CHRO|nr:DUF2808 domain-containing protein [Aphanothece hegewaldii]PSF31262.1 hypothetical protein C7H19_23040 [Aphanothece hegewaldii CCALA 016]
MLKTSISVIAIFGVTTTFNFPASASENIRFTALPYIDSSVQFPRTRVPLVRHTIRISVPQNSKAISQLKLRIPYGLSAKNDITVTDESGRELTANTSVSEDTIIINFPQPVESGTELKIDMNRVVISRHSPIWLYRVTAQLVGLQPELNLGVARIRGYFP